MLIELKTHGHNVPSNGEELPFLERSDIVDYLLIERKPNLARTSCLNHDKKIGPVNI